MTVRGQHACSERCASVGTARPINAGHQVGQKQSATPGGPDPLRLGDGCCGVRLAAGPLPPLYTDNVPMYLSYVSALCSLSRKSTE